MLWCVHTVDREIFAVINFRRYCIRTFNIDDFTRVFVRVLNRSTSMALLRYLKPVDGVSDPGRSLSCSLPELQTSEGRCNRGPRQTGENFRGK